jgi:C4-dicarboxylate-specific signal transduction histidine kinase
VLRWFGTNTDITEQRKAESDIRRLLHEAEVRERELKEQQESLVQAGKLASIGELASGIAHELNNPLNNIGLFVGNVLDSVDPNSVHGQHVRAQLQQTLQQVGKAARIINELRSFSRMANSDKELVHVNHIIESTLLLLQEQLRLDEITVETHLPDDSVVAGDAIQLEQVLINLLTNAKDALEEAEEKRLTIGSVRHGDWVEVTVQDSGCGIAPDIGNRIFDPFFTTKQVGKGTGLGLSISYGIIKEHGGTITVESSPGKGTCFMVRLPLAERTGQQPVEC